MSAGALRIGWRRLAGDPGYAAVILVGLASAVACCCLVAQVVFNQVLPDPQVPDPASVVSIEFKGNLPGHDDDWIDAAPFVFGPALRAAGAPVTAIARVEGRPVALSAGNRLVPTRLLLSDVDLIALFGLRPLRGDLRAALTQPSAIALTPDAARRLFGEADPLGGTVRLHDQAFTVVALVAPPVPASALRFEALAAIDMPGKRLSDAWYTMSGNLFARVVPGHDAADVGRAAQAVFDDGPGAKGVPPEWTANGRHGAFLRAVPLTRRALEGAGGEARRAMLLGLAASAALVLLLAVANYVNLTLARTLRRTHEIAIRKSLGASPRRLAAQFVAESALTAALAGAAGVLLAWLFAPVLGTLLDLDLGAGLFAPLRLAGFAAGALLLGVVTGLHPARIALRVPCAETLAGRVHDDGDGGRRLRRALTALQFTAALTLAGAAGAVQWQNHHVATLDRGFRSAGLLAVDLPDGVAADHPDAARAFRDALAREHGVRTLAWSGDVPARGFETEVGTFAVMSDGAPRTRADLHLSSVDTAFFDVYGIAPLAGRARVASAAAASTASAPAPSPEMDVVLDTTAMQVLGFASPEAAVGQLLAGGGDYMQLGKDRFRVAAVIPRIRQESAHDARAPMLLRVTDAPQNVLTLAGPDMAALRQAVQVVWPRVFPQDELTMGSVDEQLGDVYERDRRIGRMAAAGSLLALMLAGFGVYALTAHVVRRSAREIVIRKLYGAGPARIARLVAREFAPLLALAAVVGLPLAAWIAHAWLTQFVERTSAAFWALPIALVLLLAMTACAAARHAIVAMTLRPTAALRD
jgi:putative ABC transport system permease protein